MSGHAILAASSSKRWLTCTPSARFEEQFPESESAYAVEGTVAHTLAELLIKCIMGGNDGADVAEVEEFIAASEYCDQAMQDYIDGYVDFVMERFAEAKARSKDAILLTEQRLDFSEWVPDGFGTGDVVIISDDLMEVIDLKYGKGVPVDAAENPQLRLYGLGAYGVFGILYEIKRIRMTIVQPRLDSISSDEMAVEDLLEWAEREIKPKAQLAFTGEGKYVAGDHCQFCRGAAVCRARAEENLKLVKYEFTDPNILMPDEIADILGKIDELTTWASTVKEYALEQAEKHGVKWPGWKLVEGRSNRKYTDEEAVANILTSAGYSEVDIYKPREIKGITEMEKLVGKKKFIALLENLIIKPPGKPVLVPESDKRPEIGSASSAKSDFAD